MKLFSEYIDEKGKTVTKAKVDAKADFSGYIPDKPRQGKNTKSYMAGKNSHEFDVKPDKSGFAFKGPKELEYNPDSKGSDKIPSFPKCDKLLPCEAFLESTSAMPINKFVEFVADSTKAGSTSSHPAEYVKYVTNLIKENNNVANSFVMEAKRKNLLGLLVYEALQHSEGVQTLVDIMGDSEVGPAFCRKLCRTMACSEEVSPPMADNEEEKEKEIPTDAVGGEPTPQPQPSDEEPEEEESEPEPHNDIPNPDEEHEEESEEEEMPPQTSAHENMVNAMSGHKILAESMFSAMKKLAGKKI